MKYLSASAARLAMTEVSDTSFFTDEYVRGEEGKGNSTNPSTYRLMSGQASLRRVYFNGIHCPCREM